MRALSMQLVIDNSDPVVLPQPESVRDYHSHWLLDQLLSADDDREARRLYVELGLYLRLHNIDLGSA